MRYGVRSSINCGRLIPRVRRVRSRICILNLSRAFGAMRRSLPSFEMLKPRNLRSSGRATALFASLTVSRSFVVRNRLTEAITRSPAPLWGSLITRINALIKGRVGNFNALLYGTLGPSGVLRDITSGNNDTDGLLDGQFAAGTGWDACTGWGAPDGAKFLNALKP